MSENQRNQTNPVNDCLVDTKTLAEITGMTERFWRNLRSRNGGKNSPRFVRISPNAVRYWLSDVRAWLAERTVEVASEINRPQTKHD